MKKHNIKLLVLSFTFVSLSLGFLVYEIILVSGAIQDAYNVGTINDPFMGLVVAIGNAFIFMVDALAVLTGAGSLPFTLTLLHREGKKWFTILPLIAGIIIIVLAILTYLSMSIIPSLNPISSSSMSTSSTY